MSYRIAQFVQYDIRCNVLTYNIIQIRHSQHAHKSARHAVACAVGHNADFVVAKLANPVEVAAHHAARFVEYEKVREDASDVIFWGEQGALNPPRVVDAGLYLLALRFDMVALRLNLIVFLGQKSVLLGELGVGSLSEIQHSKDVEHQKRDKE